MPQKKPVENVDVGTIVGSKAKGVHFVEVECYVGHSTCVVAVVGDETTDGAAVGDQIFGFFEEVSLGLLGLFSEFVFSFSSYGVFRCSDREFFTFVTFNNHLS